MGGILYSTLFEKSFKAIDNGTNRWSIYGFLLIVINNNYVSMLWKNTLSRFGTMPDCDRQRDGQTDG